VRQPPRAGGAQSEGRPHEDAEVDHHDHHDYHDQHHHREDEEVDLSHRYKLFNILSMLGLVSRLFFFVNICLF